MMLKALSALFVIIWSVERSYTEECEGEPKRFMYSYKVSELDDHCVGCVSFKDTDDDLQQYTCKGHSIEIALEKLHNDYLRSTKDNNYNNYNYGSYYRYGRRKRFSRHISIVIKTDEQYNKQNNVSELTQWTWDDLYTVDLSNFNLTNQTIEHLDMWRFPNLIDLNLKNTSVDLETTPFKNLTKLQVINLSHNRIKTVKKDNFVNLPTLFKLDLSHNEIDSLPADVFDTQTYLEELVLSNNKLANFELNLKNISLDLSYNKLMTFGVDGNFRKLDLSHNAMTKFSYNITSVTTYLNLSYNQLDAINLYANNANKLRVLDLGNNLLSRLNTTTLIFKRLFTVDISNNLFNSIGYGNINNWISLFLHSGNLDKVNLGRNPWTCSDLKDMIHSLEAKGVQIDRGTTFDKTNLMGIECSAPVNGTLGDESSMSNYLLLQKVLALIHNRTVPRDNTIPEDVRVELQQLSNKTNQLQHDVEKIMVNQSTSNVVQNLIQKSLGGKTVLEQKLDEAEEQLTATFDALKQKESNGGQIAIITMLSILMVSALVAIYVSYSRSRTHRAGGDMENVGLVNV